MDEKEKFEMEFPILASPSLLYQYISTPSGLSEWYAENVNSRGEIFTFIWNGTEEKAKLLGKKSGERIKFKWEQDDKKEYFFEMRIEVDEITQDVSLIITDFSTQEEMDENKMLWDNLVSDLKHVLGST